MDISNTIDKAKAKRYHGDELDEKLKELLFCRFEKAKEVVKKEMGS